MVGFLYQAAKAQAEDYLKTKDLKEAIITVPSYFSKQQREIVSQIARSLAGFESAPLINELTAGEHFLIILSF